jgi:hypothetical protein
VVLISLFLVVLVYANYQVVHVPEKGFLVIQCTVNGLPTPPDNNIIHINGTIFYTDSNGSCSAQLNPGFYVVTASYLNQSQEQTVTIDEAQTVTTEINWTAFPPPPDKGTLDVTCTVNDQPHVPDNSIITINGQNFATDPNGHYVTNVALGSYTVSASYMLAAYNQSQTQTTTVTVGHTSYVNFVWITEAPPPIQGTLDVQCLVDGVAHAPDNNIITINGLNYVTDMSGHYTTNIDPRSYTVTASYFGTPKTAITTVTAGQISYVILTWQTQPPLPSENASTICVAGTYSPINTPHERKSFYANERHWQFYYNDVGTYSDPVYNAMVYSTSLNGITWSKPTLFYKYYSTFPDFLDIEFDGTYLHVAYVGYGGSKYRKGVPNADGSITWLADWQTISEVASEYCCDPTMCIDSFGCPWIGFYYETDRQLPVVVKSARNDGIWQTAPGFPYFLNSNEWYRGVGMVALTQGKVYALYYRAFNRINIDPPISSGVIYGKLWDGASWGAQEQVSISHVEQYEFHQLSFVSYGDEIHLTFLKEATGEIIYLKRTMSGWSSEVVIGTVSDYRCAPLTSYSVPTNTLYCFWADGTCLYYRKYVGGVWQPKVLWIQEQPIGACTLILNGKVCCFEWAYNGIIGVTWWYADKAPYPSSSLIRYAFLSTGWSALAVYNILGVEVSADLGAVLLMIGIVAIGIFVFGYKKKHR